jgi:hypothetical protein
MIEVHPASVGIAGITVIAAAFCLLSATEGRCDSRQSSDRFQAYLALGYREVSSLADRNGEALLAQHFLARSRQAASDQQVEPDAPTEPTQSSAREAGLARQQLVARLDGGARRDQPLLAAIAQVNFDCWVAPLPTRIGVPDGDECRRRFYFAFAGLFSPETPAGVVAASAPRMPVGGNSTKERQEPSGPACLGGPVSLDCQAISFTGPGADNLIEILRASANPEPLPQGAVPSSGSPEAAQSDRAGAAASSGRPSAGTASGATTSSGPSSSGDTGSASAGLGGAAGDATGTAGSTLGDAGGTVGGAVGSTVDATSSAVGETTGSVAGAVGATVGAVGGAVGQTVDSVSGAVGSSTSALGGAVGGVGRAAGSLLK